MRTRVSAVEREMKEPLWYTRLMGLGLGEWSEAAVDLTMGKVEGTREVRRTMESERLERMVNLMAIVRIYQ